jgi:hypothetical protein
MVNRLPLAESIILAVLYEDIYPFLSRSFSKITHFEINALPRARMAVFLRYQ